MPNMFGGDQFHPAYMPREIGDNEDLDGDIHWTIQSQGDRIVFRGEHVDGRVFLQDNPPTDKLRVYVEKLASKD